MSLTLLSVPPFQQFAQKFQVNITQFFGAGRTVYRTDLSKEELWDAYLAAYPEEDGIRQSFNCNACKSFIVHYGGLVLLNDDLTTTSLWEGLTLEDVPEFYRSVAQAMDELVKSASIRAVFVPESKCLGNSVVKGSNYELLENGSSILRHHFYYEIPRRWQAPFLSENKSRENFEMLARALQDFSLEATEIALELCGQINTGSKGDIRPILTRWHQVQTDYAKNPVDNFLWSLVKNPISRIRGDLVATLLGDLSSGMDINRAVAIFETKCNGANYQRPTPILTPRMIEEAKKTITELGFEGSLARRPAVLADIPVTQVLFVDRTVRTSLAGGDIFEQLKGKTATKPLRNLDRVEEISIANFLENELPNAEGLEILFEPGHIQNLFSLTAAVDPDAPSLFKWDSGIGFVYKGGVANAIMTDRVKELGGKITGELGFTLGWNFDGKNNIDFDAHCIDPSGFHIYFPIMNRRSPATGGKLDVDIRDPGTELAVENINWAKAHDGVYNFIVKNFAGYTSKGGFKAEIRFFGTTYEFEYPHNLPGHKVIPVAKIQVKGREIKFLSSLPQSISTQEVWGLKTHEFHEVQLACFSPNHWEDEGYGNKNLFFVLKDAQSDEETRGFFNEFLNPALTPHRKVMEAIALETAAPIVSAGEQLSGVGFPLNARSSFIVRLKSKNNIQRVIKVTI